MKQGWKALAVCLALAMAAVTVAPVASPVADVAFAAKKASSASKAREKTYQWTGVIVELDKSSLTVKKGKKKPQSRVFTMHEKMRVKDDAELEEGARVTVYYRKSGKKHVAHRVVVKES